MYARCLAASDDVEVIAARTPGCNSFDSHQTDFSIHRFDYPWRKPPFGPLRRILQLQKAVGVLNRFLERHEYGVLEVSTPFPGALAAQILRRRYEFYLISYALGDDVLGPLNSWMTGRLFRLVLQGVDLFIAISRYTKQILLNAGVAASQVVIIRPSISRECFEAKRNGTRFESILPPHDLMLLTVSRLVEKKGIDQIIKLMPRLTAEFPELLYVVGGDGPDLPRLQRLAREYGVADSVVFLGHVQSKDLADLYAASDVFVMPTRTDAQTGSVEGFGIVFLEAGSQGVPVIGPRQSGSEDAIIEGVTGYLIDPYNPREIEMRITRLLSDPGLRGQLGAAGRERALQPSDWSPLLNLDLERHVG
jgi:glycosyltransferase involved in cell wall biosynthesis